MSLAAWESMFPFLFFGGFIALAIVAVVFGWLHEKKRTERFGVVAGQLGLEFVDKPLADDYAVCRHLKLFNQGHGRRGRNMLRGKTGDIDVLIFDYKYTVGSGKNSTTYNQSVAAFECPGMQWPAFRMSPESFFHRIGEVFGMTDIDFDDHPAFSKKYRLEGDSEAAVRALFDEPVLQHFDEAEGYTVEGSGDVLVVYRGRKRLKPDDTRQWLEESFRIFELFRAGASRQGAARLSNPAPDQTV